MAIEAHYLLPVRGRGAVVADPTETKKQRHHGDCGVGLASMPPHAAAVGPPVYVVPAATTAGTGAAAAVAPSSRKRACREEDEAQFASAAKRRVIDFLHPAAAVLHHHVMVSALRDDHVQKLKAEAQRWRRYAVAVAGQLMARDEAIGAARWTNRLLQEQARAAHVQARAWRDAAVRSEAAAAALRADLHHALRAQQQAREAAESAAVEDSAESCCSGGNDEGDGSSVAYGTCRCCGDRDAAAVLLPCRHLSACVPCAAVARACPACGIPTAGSVAVNLV